MSNLNKVLIADDDPNVCEIIRLYFDQHRIELIETDNGADAVKLVRDECPDVVILDVMMPSMDGFEACRHIRKEADVPIIMLTAKDEEFDRVLGLELGADDYVTKPFSPREIMARIKAILRRIPTAEEAASAARARAAKDREIYEVGDLKVRTDRREVSVDGNVLSFRPKEFDLLTHLIQNPDIVFTRDQLLQKIWGYDYFGDIRTVDVHIKKIRQKLQKYGVDNIQTVWGVGYRFQLMAETEGESS